MAERRENSVLFSLRELRTIEEDRVKGEEEAERARIEAERKAREDEERRRREAEEAKIRAEQDRIKREQDEREHLAREHDLRLKEAERRAQIDAATKLEQTRIEADARARMDAKKFPMGAVVGGIGGLVVLAAIVMGVLVHNHNEELKAQQAESQAKLEAEQKKLRAEAEKQATALKKELEGLQSQLDKTSDEAEKAKLRAAMAAARERTAKPTASAKHDDKGSTTPKPKPTKVDTSDPLGGLPGL
jgi:hypothetical protein